MKDRICLVTGANSGIGKATSLGLAGMGATVVMVCRDRTRGEIARREIEAASQNHDIYVLQADLSSQADIRHLVQEFKSDFSQLHVLINNAGVAPSQRSQTVDGIETTFAVNYLAPFLLTNLLLDVLKASAPARVMNVAGDFHRKASLNFDDLMSENGYNGIRANNQAKLALILFTYELARQLAGTGVTANCLHPGAVGTGAPLKDPHLSPFGRFMYRLIKPFFLSPEKGAQTSLYLASSPEVEEISGKYFIKNVAVASSPDTYNEETARHLWAVSEQLTGNVNEPA